MAEFRRTLIVLVLSVVVSIPGISPAAGAHVAPALIGSFSVPAFPEQIAVNSTTNRIYVTHAPSNSISVFDGATHALIAVVPVGRVPVWASVNERSNRVYVSNIQSRTVSVVDGLTNAVVAEISLIGEAVHSAVDELNNRVYVASGIYGLTVIDGATNMVTATIPTGGGSATGVAVNAATGRAYVSSQTTAELVVVDTTTQSVVTSIPVPPAPFAVAVNLARNKVYVASGDSHRVSVIDGGSNAVVATLPFVGFPSGIGVNSDTDRVYVSNPSIAFLHILDAGTDVVVGTVNFGSLGNIGHGIAIDRAEDLVYAVAAGGRVGIVGEATSTTTTITSSANPSGVGQSVTFTATVTGGSPANSDVVIFFIDGVGVAGFNLVAGTARFTRTFASAGTFDVRAEYLGGLGLAGSSGNVLQTVTSNRPPSVSLSGPVQVGEGSGFAIVATTSDPDSDPLTTTWNVTSGRVATWTIRPDGQAVDVITTDGPDVVIVSATVRDPAGASAAATRAVNVLNIAPVATLSVPARVSEGAGFVVGLQSPVDPSVTDVAAGFTYAFDCDSGILAIALGPNTTCGAVDDALLNVRGRITDKDGGSSLYQANVVVENVAPTLGPISAPADPVQAGATINVSATYSDVGTRDTHTATWSWGDGSTTIGAASDGTATGEHTYAMPGVYTLGLTLTDDDGGSATTSFQYVVVYNPNGGFVTGGGWIDSPSGAYGPDPNLSGKATFGFGSTYLPGRTSPHGSTEFQFHVAGFNFHSDAQEWLVVSGARAQFRGTGTINGTGSYRFMLTAVDGQQNSGGGTDLFRIRIWDSNGTVYDSQFGEDENGDPTTALRAGSIVINK